MAKLSIVIPVYNTDEKFLSECLQSVFDSSLDDLQVIVVDDGSSKDYSKLQKKYLNKIEYYKTENQGTLKARIFGAKKATAPYVCYVDSDDTISFDYLEAGLIKIQSEDADICFNDWAFHTEQTKYVCANDSTIKNNIVYDGDEPLQRFVMQAGREHSFYVLWNKIFKTEVLISALNEVEKLNVDRMVFAEDVLITFFAFAAAKKVVNVHLGYYFYRIHSTQQISVETEEKLKNHVDAMTFVFDVMEQELKQTSIFEQLKVFFEMWKQLLCSTNYQVAKKMKFKNMFFYIKEKYRTCKLKGMPRGHAKAYLKQRILPVNIDVIDTELKKAYHSNKYLKIYAKKNSYAFESLVQIKLLMKKRFDLVAYKRQATFVFSKEKISLKQRILHNPIVYKVGMTLFPKGSKIRRFLKSKL